jgi:hypothetical protein
MRDFIYDRIATTRRLLRVLHSVPARPTPMIVFDFHDPTDVLV